MNCVILSRLYMKSNGRFLCYDDFGERVLLGTASPRAGWSLDRMLEGPSYQRIFQAFARGDVPWPGVCEKCALLQPAAPASDSLSRHVVETFQVEPTLTCRLQCPACSNRRQKEVQPPPHRLDVDLYEHVLRQIRRERYRVKCVEFAGQGEPLAHPNLAEFLRSTRRLHPEALRHVVTNGNHEYGKAFGDERPHLLTVACDGFHQHVYEKYRIGGDVRKVLDFMQEAVLSRRDGLPSVVWKYILFRHNDSDEEIHAARQAARRIGIDSLEFVLTESEGRSERYGAGNCGSLLAEGPPSMHVKRATPDPNDERLPLDRRDNRRPLRMIFCHVDEVSRTCGGLIRIKGWAADRFGQPLKEIAIFSKGVRLGVASLNEPRLDIPHAQGNRYTARAGFSLTADWSSFSDGDVNLEFRMTAAWGLRDRFRVRCRAPVTA